MAELAFREGIMDQIRLREQRFDERAYLFVLASLEHCQARLTERRHCSRQPTLALVDDPDPDVRGAALTLLTGFTDARVGQAAVKLLGDEDWWPAINAADVVGRIGDPASVPALIAAAERDEVTKRVRVSTASSASSGSSSRKPSRSSWEISLRSSR